MKMLKGSRQKIGDTGNASGSQMGSVQDSSGLTDVPLHCNHEMHVMIVQAGNLDTQSLVSVLDPACSESDRLLGACPRPAREWFHIKYLS